MSKASLCRGWEHSLVSRFTPHVYCRCSAYVKWCHTRDAAREKSGFTRASFGMADKRGTPFGGAAAASGSGVAVPGRRRSRAKKKSCETISFDTLLATVRIGHRPQLYTTLSPLAHFRRGAPSLTPRPR